MTYDVAVYVVVALVISGVLFIPKRVGLRRRAQVGGVLFVIGWTGIFGGLALSDKPPLQSEAAALIWMGGFGSILVLSIVLLVPAAFEAFRLKTGSRKRH